MSGGSRKKFKQFPIHTAEDACAVLGGLISQVIPNLKKYGEYSLEAERLLEEYADRELVPAKSYDDVNDKLLYRQRELLKYIADRQSASFSYLDFRGWLVRQKYLSKPLGGDMSRLLNEMLDLRNWSFHNVQALSVAAKEVSEKRLPEELKGAVALRPQLNPLLVPQIEFYETKMLASLVLHTRGRIGEFSKILASMKADYQALYDSLEGRTLSLGPFGFTSEVRYVEQKQTVRLMSRQADIIQLSMAIQQSRYDGTDAAFHKYAVTGAGGSESRK